MATINLLAGETSLRNIVAAIRALIRGGSNATGVVTLTPNSATTIVPAVNCPPGGHVFLFPATAHAAAEVAAGGLYVASANVVAGQFTINHANNAQADRTFYYVTLG